MKTRWLVALLLGCSLLLSQVAAFADDEGHDAPGRGDGHEHHGHGGHRH